MTSYRYKAPLIIFCAAMFAVFPYATLLLCTILLQGGKGKLGARLTLAVFVLLFCRINLNKYVDGDLIWYIEHYLTMAQGQLATLFELPYFGVQAKYTEPVYHLTAYILANITNGSVFVYLIFFTSTIYIASYMAIEKLADHVEMSGFKLSCVVVCLLTLCITFTVTAHLIRQCIAGSLFLLALSYLIKNRYILFFGISMLGAMTHNAIIIPFALCGSVYFLYKKFPLMWVAPLMFPIAACMALVIPYVSDSEGLYSQWDGDISPLVVIYDAFLLTVAWFFVLRIDKSNIRIRSICIQLLLFSSVFLIFCSSLFYSPLLQLRYYLFYDFFRVMVYFVLILCFQNDKGFLGWYAIWVLVGLTYTWLRIDRSVFSYGGNIIYYMFKPLVHFI